jgi:S1-C subfamily serine protease
MMREHESDSGDDRPGPYDYISPWAARDTGEADQAPAADADLPRESDHQDTIAFGSLGGEADQGSYVQHGYPDPWYESDRGEAGYGSYVGPESGYGSGGSGSGSGSGGYGSGGGWDPGPPPRRARRRGHLLIYLTVAALAAGIGAGLTVAFDGQGSSPSAGVSASDIPSSHDNQSGSGPGSGLNQAAVEQKVVPGLVDITSTLKYASETAEGTGMILSPSGLVLTNNHVIDGATNVKVTLASNGTRSYPARVVGYDITDDVALLKLSGATGLATVSFGDSSQVKVGIPVLALGDAQGRGGVTPALGSINGLNRSIQASDEGSGTTEDLNHMLQTNAQIQQGDSGGALVNNAGQVIGMVTAANTAAGGQPGGTMGFAIPINTALNIAQQIAANKPSAKVYIGLPGFLGVEVAQSNSSNPQRQAADEQQSNNSQGGPPPGGAGQGRLACVADGQEPGLPARIAPVGIGALILGILCGTAAQSRGLAPGDVITSVDGQAVTTPGSLTVITAKYHPGDVVSVGWVDTHGHQHKVKITLGDGPAR